VNGDRLIRVTPWWNVDIVYKIVDDMPDRHTSGDLGTAIDVPKLPERLPKPLEAGDRDQLLAALPHDTLPELRDRALILLLLSTGARISEILRLDRSDWKPDRLWVLGKGDRERIVQVTDKARAAVEDYLTARKDHSPALFIGFQPASKAASSNRLTIAGAQHVCRQLARRLGIPAFHPHQLRHTLGTLLQETIGDARLTAETLGHRGLGSVSGYTKSPTNAGAKRMRRCSAGGSSVTSLRTAYPAGLRDVRR
jgi:integrase